jgi:hypothetical protein
MLCCCCLVFDWFLILYWFLFVCFSLVHVVCFIVLCFCEEKAKLGRVLGGIGDKIKQTKGWKGLSAGVD